VQRRHHRVLVALVGVVLGAEVVVHVVRVAVEIAA
jgi:hypothetical protein